MRVCACVVVVMHLQETASFANCANIDVISADWGRVLRTSQNWKCNISRQK